MTRMSKTVVEKDPPPWDKRAYIWFLLVLSRLLMWDFARRRRWTDWMQIRNLRARDRVINHLADVTGEKQLNLL